GSLSDGKAVAHASGSVGRTQPPLRVGQRPRAEHRALPPKRYDQEAVAKGADHPDTLAARYQLALSLGRLQNLPPPAGHLRPVLEARRRTVGTDHPLTLACLMQLGSDLLRAQKYAEANPSAAAGAVALGSVHSRDRWRAVRCRPPSGSLLSTTAAPAPT